MEIRESIIINKCVEDVYEQFFDILKWKNILSDVKDINIIRNTKQEQEFEITVIKMGNYEKVHTIRKCQKNKKIDVIQPLPPPQVYSMLGTWEFDKIEEKRVKVIATRNFQLRNEFTNSNYADRLRKSLYDNLLQFKFFIEGLGLIKVEKIMKLPLDDIKDIFWKIHDWGKVWNPIRKVEYELDSEYVQEFTMEVEHDKKVEVIRVTQIKKEDSIMFYNTIPPRNLSIHCGLWDFQKVEGGTLVTAYRIYQTYNKDSEFFVSYKNNFKNRIESILDNFSEYIANNQEG